MNDGGTEKKGKTEPDKQAELFMNTCVLKMSRQLPRQIKDGATKDVIMSLSRRLDERSLQPSPKYPGADQRDLEMLHPFSAAGV